MGEKLGSEADHDSAYPMYAELVQSNPIKQLAFDWVRLIFGSILFD